ncbi:MAG: BON domain-containing protein [Planctomycetaceae bacterium]
MNITLPVHFKVVTKSMASAFGLGLLSLVLTAHTASAQQQSLGTGSGGTGGRTATGNTGSTAGAASAIGGAANRTTGGTGGGTGQLQDVAFGQFGATTQTPTGFIGRGDATQFIGNRAAGQQTVNAGGTTRFSGGGVGAQQSGQVQTRANMMRVQQRLAFRSQPIIAANLQLTLETQFSALSSRFPSVGIEVDAEGLTTLTGEVETEDDRKLAEAIARLEPGVRKVVNQLQAKADPERSAVSP